RDYAVLKPQLMPAVLDSWRRVAANADLVLVEGAGSPAEVNLRDHDLANMGFAEAADLPVIIVGDVERGGVIAALVGTHRLLTLSERQRVKAYIINRFRGDVRLFDGAIARIGSETGWESLGILPWLEKARLLPAEDSLSLVKGAGTVVAGSGRIRIVVPILPHGANLDDLDPLRAEPRVELILVPSGVPLPAEAELVILSGSKSTLSDLASLRREGWDGDLRGLYRRGTRILGLCGGYQMLGQTIADPDGLEGTAELAPVPGLGLLAVETRLNPHKTIRTVQGMAGGVFGESGLTGYEIHLGVSTGKDCARPLFPGLEADFPASAGATSACGRIMGSYLHGLFSSDGFRHQFLRQIAPEFSSHLDYERQVERSLDSLADLLATHVDCERILNLARA
ncbi:MAG: cobyric acid synthase, partial [Alphaproteobacteria bacterium]|nr:cobyric acid synthase [Alphaproteobacteria bacterium]